jgi:hypothetical protein
MTYICTPPWGYISAGFAFLAAIAWFASAVQRLPTVTTKQFTGVSNAGIPELVRKLRIQSGWSAAAAVLAAGAAMAQGASSVCSF